MLDWCYVDCANTVAGMGDISRSAVLEEAVTRDALWLNRGILPAPTFATPALRDEIVRKRPHELCSARKLNRHGLRTDFVLDAQKVIDAQTGDSKQIGLADFLNGYELKTLTQAATFSTIDGYLRRVAKKENAVAAVFDNSENNFLSDSQLFDFLDRSKRRFRGRVYALCKDGSYVRRY